MKTQIKIISFLLMLCIGTWIAPQKASAQGPSVSFQVFYDELSPYGTWVYNYDYGYVWLPNVDPGFTPYATDGYWIFTDEGWTWVSYYSWGWAPFHYGRWYSDPSYGPIWVPDYEWGPGWVTWRRSEGYYGWAPIGPGVSINVAYSNNYNVPYNQWTFVRDRDFGRRDIHNYYVNSSNNVTIVNNSTVINNTWVDKSRNVTYNAGPDRHEVERRAGKTFTPVAIKESSKPGQHLSRNQLQIYKPQVQKNVSTGHKPAPSKVESLENVRTSEQRTGKTPPQKVNQRTKQQPSQKQPAGQPTKQKKSQPQRKSEPPHQQSTQPQQTNPPQNKGRDKQLHNNGQPAKERPSRTQPADQPSKERPSRTQPADQPRKERPSRTQPADQPSKEQPSRTQPADQPSKEQPSKTQPADQPSKEQPSKTQPADQPSKEQPAQPQNTVRPAKQKPSQTRQANPSKKVVREKQSRQAKPPKNVERKKHPK